MTPEYIAEKTYEWVINDCDNPISRKAFVAAYARAIREAVMEALEAVAKARHEGRPFVWGCDFGGQISAEASPRTEYAKFDPVAAPKPEPVRHILWKDNRLEGPPPKGYKDWYEWMRGDRHCNATITSTEHAVATEAELSALKRQAKRDAETKAFVLWLASRDVVPATERLERIEELLKLAEDQ